MNISGLRAALALMTRLPVGQGALPSLEAAAPWLWAAGLAVGLGAWLAAWPFAFAPAAAAAALAAWLWLTGAMHLEAVADFADGLAAAHADPVRYDTARRDPAIGGAGLAAAVAVLLARFAGLMFWAEHDRTLMALLFIPACARGWAALWPLVLGARGEGMAARLARGADARAVALAQGALLLVGFVLVPKLALAGIVLGLGWMWLLHRTTRGADGDGLGAGIEVVEAGLLLALTLGGMPPHR